MITDEDFRALRRVCVLTFTEIAHLKKLLTSKGIITEKDIYDYANSLEEYMKELDSKNRLLVKDFPHSFSEVITNPLPGSSAASTSTLSITGGWEKSSAASP